MQATEHLGGVVVIQCGDMLRRVDVEFEDVVAAMLELFLTARSICIEAPSLCRLPVVLAIILRIVRFSEEALGRLRLWVAFVGCVLGLGSAVAAREAA